MKERIEYRIKSQYQKFLSSIITGEDFFPLGISIGLTHLKAGFDDLYQRAHLIISNSKQQTGKGYTVVFKLVATRNYGKQSLPVKIIFLTESDYLEYLGKQAEVAAFKNSVSLILKAMPQLTVWAQKNVAKIIVNSEDWENIIDICRYFISNPQPELYLRQLPVTVHTKFIEERKSLFRELLDHLLPKDTVNSASTTFEKRFSLLYDEPLIRFRILDQKLVNELKLRFTDLSVPVSQFEKLSLKEVTLIITENKLCFLALPELRNCLAIWGSGYKAGILKTISWFSECKLYYWGDLDVQGFQILSQLREFHPGITSIMMNYSTFDQFKHFTVPGTPAPYGEFSNLTVEENKLCLRLHQENLRLEQEKLSYEYLRKTLTVMLNQD